MAIVFSYGESLVFLFWGMGFLHWIYITGLGLSNGLGVDQQYFINNWMEAIFSASKISYIVWILCMICSRHWVEQNCIWKHGPFFERRDNNQDKVLWICHCHNQEGHGLVFWDLATLKAWVQFNPLLYSTFLLIKCFFCCNLALYSHSVTLHEFYSWFKTNIELSTIAFWNPVLTLGKKIKPRIKFCEFITAITMKGMGHLSMCFAAAMKLFPF